MRSLKDLVEELEREGFIRSREVKEAILNIDRRNFVPYIHREEAYLDEPLPIGEDQTISAPHMVAIMLELLEIKKGMKVLEIGAGSGYNACLIEFLAYPGKVISIERQKSLYYIAQENVKRCPYSENIKIIFGDGSMGYPEEAPFDRIVVTCGAPDIPNVLLEQLSIDGIMLIPVGGHYFQELYRVIKRKEGITKENHGSVAFVPMIGKYGFKEEFYI
ncbi:MAG: protein-L-isoaspartate(D-aspartate) O-methyltransferase [Thermoplasmata archaeon]|nr:protein-L-isoaspartate(D-aspartate) O-methyltransferase [Euryarchaeota archaeon]